MVLPQIRKEGLVVDVRANGGGNVSQMLIERLGRKLLGTRFGCRSDHPATYPNEVFFGHQVALTSETSASDGDIFPTASASRASVPSSANAPGAASWASQTPARWWMVDLSQCPSRCTNAPTGEWIIEGEGVSPDIEVEDEPALALQGCDPQLERGVQKS